MLSGEEVLFNATASCALQRSTCTGRLIGTNYQLVYIPDDPGVMKQYKLRQDFFNMPLGFISRWELREYHRRSVEKRVDRKVYMAICLEIASKDSRTFRFLFPMDEKDNTVDKALDYTEANVFSKEDLRVFAFSHKLTEKEPDGWSVFNDMEEYKRMGLDFSNPDSPFKLFYGNCDGSICSSYPTRVVIASSMSDADIIECSKFRTRERFPALTYFNKSNRASIWRSSQPKVSR